jgi:EPS-associated MarR family transcriptional regulator
MTDQDVHYRLLTLVEKHPRLTQRQLAARLGVSLGKAHYTLRALVDVGWIKLGNFKRSNHKLGYTYALTPRGITQKLELTASFLARKQREYESLREEIFQLQTELDEQRAEICRAKD